MSDEYIVQMEHVSKAFGAVQANEDVSLHIKKGEIRALLGENGAGKSTLMKILYGLNTYDKGTICIDGKVMPAKYSPSDALMNGVALVPQHIDLVEVFTVAENIILGKEAAHRGIRNKRNEKKIVSDLCVKYDMHINSDSIVKSLALGQKQKVEILKALYRECKILILDEPTAILTPQEVQDLFAMLRRLQESGLTIIIVAHKLQEIMDIADQITVLRRGVKVRTLDKNDASIKMLAEMMVGKELSDRVNEVSIVEESSIPKLQMTNIATHKVGERCNLKALNLSLFSGHILGIAGIDGNGQTDLVEVLCGLKKTASGSMYANGVEISQKELHKMSIGVIPEDRHQQGLILPFTVEQNLIMKRRREKEFSWRGILKNIKIREYTNELMDKYDIRPRNLKLFGSMLSGGNQQKIVLARELDIPNLEVAIASQPTRGLDVGAQDFVYERLLGLKKAGVAVLLVSSDLDEIFALSDYIAVIHGGTIVACERADQITRNQIALYMGGEAQEVSVNE